MNPVEQSRRIVEKARSLGFDLCGVAPAEKFPELERLPEWLERGYAGEMRYLHNPKRQSPERVLPGARSVVVCAMNYNTPLPYSTEARAAGERAGWISRYAWGDDYHEVLGPRLETLTQWMRAEFAEPHQARWYVDTGPIVERVAAKWAGLGWLGKNTCLINEQMGSWLFLGVVITTLDLQPSLRVESEEADSASRTTPAADLCGQCTLCLEACPTGALVEPYVLDARRCISYLTIELRGPIPEEFHAQMGWHLFGCDICQDVCPYNRRAPATSKKEFFPRPWGEGTLHAPQVETIGGLTRESFDERLAHSAIRRTKLTGLQRNAEILRRRLHPADQPGKKSRESQNEKQEQQGNHRD